MRSLLLVSTAIVIVFSGSAQAQPLRSGDAVTVTGMRETAQAVEEIRRTAGGVAVVPDTMFKNGPVQNIKDILGYVPGVITQPRMGRSVYGGIRYNL